MSAPLFQMISTSPKVVVGEPILVEMRSGPGGRWWRAAIVQEITPNGIAVRMNDGERRVLTEFDRWRRMFPVRDEDDGA